MVRVKIKARRCSAFRGELWRILDVPTLLIPTRDGTKCFRERPDVCSRHVDGTRNAGLEAQRRLLGYASSKRMSVVELATVAPGAWRRMSCRSGGASAHVGLGELKRLHMAPGSDRRDIYSRRNLQCINPRRHAARKRLLAVLTAPHSADELFGSPGGSWYACSRAEAPGRHRFSAHASALTAGAGRRRQARDRSGGL